MNKTFCAIGAALLIPTIAGGVLLLLAGIEWLPCGLGIIHPAAPACSENVGLLKNMVHGAVVCFIVVFIVMVVGALVSAWRGFYDECCKYWGV